MRRALIVTSAMVAAAVCCGSPYEPSGPRELPTATAVAPLTPSAASLSSLRPDFLAAADGAVEPSVAAAVAEATASSRRVVVYVGAPWCEPCTAFHHALDRGELDIALAGVRFLEFDADRDSARLAAAGYGGRLIPRFALPSKDGSFTGKKIEGGIKGDGAVEHIVGRLGPLLAENAP